MTDSDGDAFFEAFNALWQNHDVDGIDAMWTDDVVFEASFGAEVYGERAEGRAAATRLAARVFERIPDVSFREVRRFWSPEFAVIESVQAGTPVGGEPFEAQIVDLLTLRDGKIAAKRTYRKSRL